MVRLGVVLSLCLMCTGCFERSIPTAAYKDEVEIAPGRWLDVEAQDTVYAEPKDEWSTLAFEWNGKKVKWAGPEVPITLREHDGTLYMIGFNRQDLNRCKYILFRLNEAGDAFETIGREDFPKQIATQNLWMRADTRYVGVPRRDTWKVLRELDTTNPFFGNTFTAKIWYYLETGKQHYEIGGADQAFLRDYVKKYKPIALPTIVKEPKKADKKDEKKD